MSSALPTDPSISTYASCTPTVRKKVASKLESSSGMKLLLYAMALVQVEPYRPLPRPLAPEAQPTSPQRKLTMGSPNNQTSYRREAEGKGKAGPKEGRKTAKRRETG